MLINKWQESPQGQALRKACLEGTLDKKEIFSKVKERFAVDPAVALLDKSEQNKLLGQMSAWLRSFCPVKTAATEVSVSQLLPGPLHVLLGLYHGESNAFRRVHRLIDLFEWTMKWHTVLVMADLLQEAELTDEIKVLFASGLRVPSLGIWNLFFRKSLTALHQPTKPWAQWEKLIKLEKKHQIVAFRNGYAHGATPDDESCAQDCRTYFPVLQELIRSPIFTEMQLVLSTENGAFRWVNDSKHPSQLQLTSGHAAVVHCDTPEVQLLNLWPLASSSTDPKRPDKGRQFFYFNSLKNKKIEQLNYEWSLHYRDKQLWQPFHRALPLQEWKKVQSTPELDIFRDRIEALTEVFKGRRQEKEVLRSFCLNGKGNKMVWGPPGIGKSALLAQVFKEIQGGIDANGVALEDSYPAIIPYFIRRGTESASPERFLRYLCQELDRLYGLKGLGLGNLAAELYESLQQRVHAVSNHQTPARMVLFIDGLDEALREGSTILQYIPIARSWLSVLCASRQVPKVEEWYNRRENRVSFSVGPLSQNDIRTLLYEVVSKYDRGLTQQYIHAIAERSEGNPLYLKLLCDQLAANTQQVGVIDTLPKEMKDLYKEVLYRVTDRGRNANAQQLLLLLTETKASLSAEVVADFLGISVTAANAALDDCMELLFEDPVTTDLLDYQLFHESLREHLRMTEKKACQKYAKLVTNACFDWRSLEDETLNYALHFAVTHLREDNDGERMWALLQDEEYRQCQISNSFQYGYSFVALKEGIEWYIAQQGAQPEDDARLAYLALRAGDLSDEAVSGVDVAFDWFRTDAKSIDNVLKRIEVLNEAGYFKACLLLIWIEALRQQLQPKEARSVQLVNLILERIDDRIADGTGAINWGTFLSVEFMVYWVELVISVWDGIDLSGIYRRGNQKDLVDSLCKQLLTAKENQTILFAEINMISGMIQHHFDRSYVLLQLTRFYAENGNISEALASAVQIADDSLQSHAFHDIQEIQLESGDVAGALSTAKQANDPHLHDNALTAIAKRHAQRGELDSARKTVSSISGNLSKVYALCDILTICGDDVASKQVSIILNAAMDRAKEMVNTQYEEYALRAIARVQIQYGEPEAALQTAELMKSGNSRQQTLSAIVTLYAENGNMAAAHAILKKVSDTKLTCKALTTIASMQLSRGDLKEALATVEKVTDLEQRSDVLTSIVSAQIHSGAFQDALNIVENLSDSASISRACAVIANAQIQRGEINHARSTIQKITESNSRSEVLLAIVKAQLQSGELQAALHTVETTPVSGSIAGVGAAISNAQVAIGNIAAALDTVEKITDPHLQFDALHTIIDVQRTSGHTAACRETIKRASSVAQTITDDEYKRSAMLALTRAQREIGDEDEAFEHLLLVLDDAEQKQVDLDKFGCLTDIVKSQLKHGDIHGALITTERITNVRYKSQALREIWKAHLSKGDIQAALEITEHITVDYYKSEAFIQIGRSQQENGDKNGALETIVRITDDYYKSEAVSILARTQGLQGDGKGATNTFQLAITSTAQPSVDYYRSKAFIEIGNAQVKKEDIAGALLTAEQLHNQYEKSMFLCRVGEKQSELGDAEGAAKTLNTVKNDAQNKMDELDAHRVLVAIANVRSQRGDIRGALAVLEEVGNKWYRSQGLSSLAQLQTRNGDMNGALELTKKIPVALYQRETLCSIGQILCSSGQMHHQLGDASNAHRAFQLALDHSLQTTDDYYKSRLLLQVAESQTTCGYIIEARQTLQLALPAVESCGVPKLLLAIATMQVQHLDVECAVATAQKITDSDDQSMALCSISEAQAQQGDIDGALTTAQTIAHEAYKAKALYCIAAKQAQHSHFDGAVGTVKAIANHYYQSLAHIEIGKAQIGGGDRSTAKLSLQLASDAAALIVSAKAKKRVFTQLARAYIETGETNAALGAFELAMSCVQDDKDDAGQPYFFIEVAENYQASPPSSNLIHHFLNTKKQSGAFYQQFLSKYQQEMKSLDSLRVSLAYHPFNRELAYNSICTLAGRLYAQGELAHFQAIITACPQLNMSYLLSEPEPKYLYANLADWIDNVDDEDDQDDIRSWARRVKKGRMTEQDFAERVADLLDE